MPIFPKRKRKESETPIKFDQASSGTKAYREAYSGNNLGNYDTNSNTFTKAQDLEGVTVSAPRMSLQEWREAANPSQPAIEQVQSKLNLSSTDLRRRDVISPNQKWMAGQSQGEDAKSKVEFHENVMGSMTPVPGLQSMRKAPSIYSAGKQVVQKEGKFLNQINSSKSNIGSKPFDLKFWNIFNKPKPKLSQNPIIDYEMELARANIDALNFTNSSYNKKKLQEFRPKQDFNISNDKVLFHNDPVAVEKFNNLMKDDPGFVNYKNINNWSSGSEGNYGARNYGDLKDVTIVNRSIPLNKVYNAGIHEASHSRSVRLPATNEERKIIDKAWGGLKNYDNTSVPFLEGEAVQGELRMILGDKIGNKVYTVKDTKEIELALQKMINDNHPYVQNIKDFNILDVINSLNKIGLSGLALPATGAASLSYKNKYKSNVYPRK